MIQELMADDQTKAVAHKLMDLAAYRQRVLAHNLANLNTPGFKRQDVYFEEELAAAVKEGTAAVKALQPRAQEDAGAVARLDGNTVSFDLELAEMSKNSLLFQMASQLANYRTAMLRMGMLGRA